MSTGGAGAAGRSRAGRSRAGTGTAGTRGSGTASMGSASVERNSAGTRRCTGPRQPGPSDGAGTALVAAVVAVLLLALGLVLGLATVAAAAGRAATAADLAALAAADAARGLQPGEPCAVAATTAQRNGALLDRCEQSGDGGSIVDIWTSARYDSGWQWLDGVGVAATGRARAGPPPQPWKPQARILPTIPRQAIPRQTLPLRPGPVQAQPPQAWRVQAGAPQPDTARGR